MPPVAPSADDLVTDDSPDFELMQYFSWTHLPPPLQEVSKLFADVAGKVYELPRNSQRTLALQLLVQAKDAAVRARLGGDRMIKARKGETE